MAPVRPLNMVVLLDKPTVCDCIPLTASILLASCAGESSRLGMGSKLGTDMLISCSQKRAMIIAALSFEFYRLQTELRN